MTGERVGVAAAAVYFVAVAVLTATVDTSSLRSSADQVGDGELWRLFTSGLVVEGPAAPQIALTAIASLLVIRLVGALVWWAAVLVGHVGSALVAYGIVGLAAELGSGGADAAGDDDDFGISCVLGATLGALFAAGLQRRDPLLVWTGVVGFLALMPFSIDWYGPEHPLSFVLGAAVVACAGRGERLRRQRRGGAAGRAPRPPHH
jgi:hypothetical protein